ncbi:hypothetical protein YTPLAS18_00710 [Nitrospira sp.]|nr:hypothetical protein YTPLAS18_00710 [Nitrospira sp.]
MKKPTSRRAIRAFCLYCERTSERVKNCQRRECPLWPFRKYRGYEDPNLVKPPFSEADASSEGKESNQIAELVKYGVSEDRVN